MFNITIKRQSRNLEELIQKIEKMSRQSVETGVFIEQGEHPEAGMTYVDLARMHEEGDGDFPPRTVRPLVLHSMKGSMFTNMVARNINNYLYRDTPLNYSLSKIGEGMASLGKSFFGNISFPHMPPNSPDTVLEKGSNTPLVDEGYLKDAWAYKTSMSDYIVDSTFGG